ncbi:CrcB family protein [Apilactobacillus apisilvae]|uniref:Fluoride-specific ion channel FluC n=1 Tax=Apilactobacillus apisilvae TaxID=2923364 RepID=A0ABY4PH10_9LACO|nr:CrcB family protein [Apilactobacillus apisilvae]UQS84766.1 CrcB family protein [Apilactobacillus apisilvae]
MLIRKLIYIAFFSFIGGSIRGYLTFVAGNNHFIATIFINIIGSFLLALLTSVVVKLLDASEDLVDGLSVGLIGGFTTFSTFSFESITLLMNHQIGLGILYIIISLIGGLLFGMLGANLGKQYMEKRHQ